MKMEDLMGNPQSVRISRIIQETAMIKTLQFPFNTQVVSEPGQFLMIWVPDVDEIPMSISLQDNSSIALTVLPVGESTRQLCSLSAGDWIGIRGPFGSSFDVSCESALVIGGGVGMAPLRPLVYVLLRRNIEVILLIAAKTENELVFYDEFASLSSSHFTLEPATDDGTLGYKGLATDAAESLLANHDFDMIYTCGPELMMATLYKSSLKHRIPFQASLERFMKCGCGICGTCAMDPTGHLVCIDGPVFTGEQLSKFTDFGRYYRDVVGIKKAF